MKKYLLLFGLFLFFSACEKPSDCIESTGDIITKEVEVTPFTRIEAYLGIELIVTEGPVYKVVVETGENLMDNIEVSQHDNVLLLRDNSSCNWVREYGQTKVYVTAPNLEEIYSKSDRDIRSNGVLTYPVLRLFSLDRDGDGMEGAGTGDFYINVNNSQLVIENNNVSRFYLSGQTNEALLNLYAGDGRIEAQDLIAQHIKVYHRGSNDMIVHPIQSLTGGSLNGGGLFSTGNLISVTYPPIRTPLPVHYIGQVIYP